MKKLLIVLAAVLFAAQPALCRAETVKVNLADIDKKLSGEMFTHCMNYPPKFNSDEQKKRITAELAATVSMLDSLNAQYPNDQNLLLRAGLANSMAYNLDLPDSGPKCEKYFKQLLKLNPDHPQGNFYFGGFLGQTNNRIPEGIKYLKKAESLGSTDAARMIGISYANDGNKKDAVAYLEKYLKARPGDKHTAEVLEAIKNGKYNYYKVGADGKTVKKVLE